MSGAERVIIHRFGLAGSQPVSIALSLDAAGEAGESYQLDVLPKRFNTWHAGPTSAFFYDATVAYRVGYEDNPDYSALQDIHKFSFSPGSTRICYSADKDTNRIRDVYVANIDGTGLTKLSSGLDTGLDVDVFVESPDGQVIAARVVFDETDARALRLSQKCAENLHQRHLGLPKHLSPAEILAAPGMVPKVSRACNHRRLRAR